MTRSTLLLESSTPPSTTSPPLSDSNTQREPDFRYCVSNPSSRPQHADDQGGGDLPFDGRPIPIALPRPGGDFVTSGVNVAESSRLYWLASIANSRSSSWARWSASACNATKLPAMRRACAGAS